MQTAWGSMINPVLANPASTPILLTGVSLSVGDNVINHRLAKKLQGWMVVDIDAPSTIYRSAPIDNITTLTLNASAATVVSLLVF